MANCIVLGANGFVGSHLVDSLVAAGHTVRAFDRFSKPALFAEHENIEKFTGDFLNRHDLKQAVQGMEYVFHFISMTTPITAENDPLIDIDTNIHMSVELFQECAEAGVKKVIFASTGGSIYGLNANDLQLTEEVAPQPISPYAIGKLTIEHYLHYFDRKFGLKSLVYRISNPYGERQSLKSKQGVIPIFLDRIAQGGPVKIFGDGSMVRDYIYVKDVADMVTASFKDAQQNLYNLGSGQSASINEVIDTIKTIVDKPVKIEHQENLSTFVDKVVLDTSRFQDEFHIVPSVSLTEGVKRTWEYILERHDT